MSYFTGVMRKIGGFIWYQKLHFNVWIQKWSGHTPVSIKQINIVKLVIYTHSHYKHPHLPVMRSTDLLVYILLIWSSYEHNPAIYNPLNQLSARASTTHLCINVPGPLKLRWHLFLLDYFNNPCYNLESKINIKTKIFVKIGKTRQTFPCTRCSEKLYLFRSGLFWDIGQNIKKMIRNIHNLVVIPSNEALQSLIIGKFF